jgi:formate hydrogenlyase subunit 6/NADH:ubiquinone oxidoreductase subunit I
MKLPGKMVAELFRNVTKPPATIQYPFKKLEIPKDSRGRILFTSENCIGCNICVRDCPADAVRINKPGEEKIFEAVFNLDECIYCAQCVFSCPKKALSISDDIELAQLSRQNLRMVYPAKPKPPKEPEPASAG